MRGRYYIVTITDKLFDYSEHYTFTLFNCLLFEIILKLKIINTHIHIQYSL